MLYPLVTPLLLISTCPQGQRLKLSAIKLRYIQDSISFFTSHILCQHVSLLPFPPFKAGKYLEQVMFIQTNVQAHTCILSGLCINYPEQEQDEKCTYILRHLTRTRKPKNFLFRLNSLYYDW